MRIETLCKHRRASGKVRSAVSLAAASPAGGRRRPSRRARRGDASPAGRGLRNGPIAVPVSTAGSSVRLASAVWPAAPSVGAGPPRAASRANTWLQLRRGGRTLSEGSGLTGSSGERPTPSGSGGRSPICAAPTHNRLILGFGSRREGQRAMRHKAGQGPCVSLTCLVREPQILRGSRIIISAIRFDFAG